MLFSAHEMGQEKYYIYTDSSRPDIFESDFNSLSGKRIGVIADSVLIDMYTVWASENGIDAEIVPLNSFEGIVSKLKSDELDAIVSSEATERESKSLTRIACIGGTNIYFAVNKERPDLKEELDDAMRKMKGTNPYFAEDLHRKYMSPVKRDSLSPDELKWLDEHGPIRIAYLRNK